MKDMSQNMSIEDDVHIEFSHEDRLKLIEKLKENIPTSVKSSIYHRAFSSVDWNLVSFEGHSGEDCKIQWKSILEKVRTYRIAEEVLDEALEKINDFSIMPKKPKTVYIRFYQDYLAELKNAGINYKAEEFRLKLSQAFKELLPEKIQEYKNAYLIDKAEYDNNCNKIYQMHPELNQKSKKVKTHILNFENKSTKGNIEYEATKMYVDRKVAKVFAKKPHKDPVQLQIKFTHKWLDLPEQRKEILRELAKEAILAKKRNHEVKKKKPKLPDVDPNEPKKPASSAYMVFQKSIRVEKGENFLKTVNKKWNSFSEEEKSPYIRQWKHENRKYIKKMKKYSLTLSGQDLELFYKRNPKFKPDEVNISNKQPKQQKVRADSTNMPLIATNKTESESIIIGSEDTSCDERHLKRKKAKKIEIINLLSSPIKENSLVNREKKKKEKKHKKHIEDESNNKTAKDIIVNSSSQRDVDKQTNNIIIKDSNQKNIQNRENECEIKDSDDEIEEDNNDDDIDFIQFPNDDSDSY